ncbi:ankyrin repeat and MYND domain-containing protein 2 [Agrilus planipennis]|uniref:Ankyrin repeat and MYND domain-containing protein 2 n=1 Tax=Agrilus planipennis TaxID=224129 RepID=A0A1W4XCH7_AGRPL|nr:ankyrin repeat and MYND domain-containing protein 2 [Agrilus planipennis]
MTDELGENEKKIFEAIEKNDVVSLKNLLVNKQNVNILDENLMTPLQHAAYKGNKEMVQALLDQGADVNLCKHVHEYTALHFAGLSGNAEVCSLLLLAGAKTNAVNSVGRTAAQMAAFVGNHNCVATINNFVPKNEIDYYNTLQGQQTKPYLPTFLTESFHKFVTQINLHPIRVALNLQKYVGLIDHLEEIKKVLELMCTKEMKRGAETNEVMSFKFHYLGCIVSELEKIKSKKSEQGEEKKTDILELFCKKLLKADKDGNLNIMDQFIRESVRSFPYRECTIFKQMVANLASKDSPSALSIVTSAINGHRGFIDNVPVCNACGEEKPAKKCSKCKVVQYCDRDCQRLHWFIHKKSCSRLSQEIQKQENVKPNSQQITEDMQNIILGN